jgi:hypothetical protein
MRPPFNRFGANPYSVSFGKPRATSLSAIFYILLSIVSKITQYIE